MDARRQPKIDYWEMLDQLTPKHRRPDEGGEEVIQAAPIEEERALSARAQPPALANDALMERICEHENIKLACKRVMDNKGKPGVDAMSVRQLPGWLDGHKQELTAALLDGSYQPTEVLGAKIPKPGGGMRQLGIPTVVDRLVQQMILQVLGPILDASFSDSSHGFRIGHSTHGALAEAREHVAGGFNVVVDIDLEKFFDRINHDILMNRVSRHVKDKRLLRIIGRFLRAGLMENGVCVGRHEGAHQGGPLSPLLANLLLTDLDRELEHRGHRFVRYADDCNIYVRSLAAGERVMASVSEFLEKKLHLRVNREKSAVAFVQERKFLGCRLLPGGRLGIAPQSLDRAKERVREITRRNRGIGLEEVIGELNLFLTGWVAYFAVAECKSHLQRMDEWIRRKLRCLRLKQCKRPKPIADWLRKLGVPRWRAWILARSGKGWWRMSGSPSVNEAMPNDWFESQGLLNLTSRYEQLQH